ncbi:MAG: hypothetical protein QME14_00745 [Methanobacteriaceae archaeon]|nr:hypothetical protein [Methanobacteriaceae archaeon]
MDELLEFILKLKSDSKLKLFDEASTKQAIILKILSNLGWDIYNVEEVVPEYSVGKRKVDYSLRDGNFNKVFIEVKKVDEDLEKHQNQLLDYSFHQGVKLAILSNGITWWFYLPLNEGSWEQRKFYTVEIYDQDARKIVNSFYKFLSKENVISGKAVEDAEKIHKSTIKDTLVKETLPEAWNKLLKEPDENLVELLAETTEKLCGYKPDYIDVGEFLNSYNPETTIKSSEETKIIDKEKKNII